MKHTSTKKLTTLGLLCTLAYIATVFGRVPLILFLKYDPKDVVIVIGGLLFSPLTALAISVIVSVTEMFTVSSTGFWGCLMNVISSCAFACPAAYVYGKRRRLSSALGGLLGGWGCQVAVMMLWNYLVAPVYMGYSREAVAQLLLPAFLPFNVIKGGLNAGIALLLYKPVVTALRRSHLAEALPASEPAGKMRFRPGAFLTALFLLASCLLLFLSLRGAF
ncbi:ECF transporter S component [uncultured Acetatifactor sp.]|uniref:ECF transporter S component n=1 Tax=uncultured Acetatifactor sp. TaxID=1671927 RepID=UPI002607BD6C|nr:ECF transporter S component [uncultured Acetatifactor sp.]